MTYPTATTHPWTLRLSVDVDPAGNPIGRHITLFEGGVEKSTIEVQFPDPFDSLSDAWADLVTNYVNFMGLQPTLF